MAWQVGDLTLFEALMGGGFDRRNWQHGGEFDQNFQKSQMPWGLPGGGGMGGFEIDRYITDRGFSYNKYSQWGYKNTVLDDV